MLTGGWAGTHWQIPWDGYSNEDIETQVRNGGRVDPLVCGRAAALIPASHAHTHTHHD
jgi:hypothetical protein